jgi:DNA polymerase III subunit gamma/tau
VWDTKYRPLRFEDVLGQPGTIQVLRARLANGTALDRNYILAGGFGQGKTTLARIMARAMLCLNRDPATQEPCNECDNCRDMLVGESTAYVEQDAASGGTIDKIRAIVEDLPFAVFNAPKRIYTFDEAHRMSKDAQDVLLKPLEEQRMVGIFCTTELEKIRGAIRSRCDEFIMRKVTRDDILVRMRSILTAENVVFEDEAVLIVIDYSGGHVRDVVSRLEMIAQMGDLTVGNVRDYLHLSVVSTFYEILLSLSDPSRAIELAEQACAQVTPSEVAAGLAEAAMNSFRLAHKMHTDFTYVDRSLALRVYEQYKEVTVQLARWFLRTHHTSKVGLLCDILNCVSGVPQDTVAPVQIVAVSSPVSTPALAPTPSSAQVSASAPPPGPVVSAPVSSTPTPTHAPASAPVQPAASVSKPQRIGNLGSDDRDALTDLDTRAIPDVRPRTTTVRGGNLVLSEGPVLNGHTLSPADWRKEFERSWKGLHQS